VNVVLVREEDFLEPFRAVETVGDPLRRTRGCAMRVEICLKDSRPRLPPTVTVQRALKFKFKFKRSETMLNG